uniref:hypothetical protein n=2 Tax=Lactiplantibacillus pentosus TaxID=1589 RepID=UPI001C200CD0
NKSQGGLFVMDEEKEQKLRNSENYLVKYKGYVTCLGCGELIAPNEYGHGISMCINCQKREQKE